ncbi:hypothetical protein [Azospirillum picis]|uniref:Uncharacterized protein n=1 Tax=Azospirillum picis TaxID=488438 RepID=A0ABU0MMV6_9PROT|nr:hypothetical protein [Azospirillum picis]MBP2301230.1 hypothetical protein [Azospirillum picis]MDQ0534807.1 hypothetical protein [Azospirillum picis]
MAYAALAIDEFQGSGAGQLFGPVAKALAQTDARKMSAKLAEFEAVLRQANAEGAMMLNRIRSSVSAKLNVLEKASADGLHLDIRSLGERLNAVEREDAAEIDSLLKELGPLSKQARQVSPDLAHFLKVVKEDIEAYKEAYINERRSVRARLRKMEERASRMPKDRGKIEKATKLYSEALSQAFGYAKLTKIDVQTEGDLPVYVMKIQVSPALYRDAKQLVSLERKAEEIIESKDPSLVGFLAIQYEPMTSAAT